VISTIVVCIAALLSAGCQAASHKVTSTVAGNPLQYKPVATRAGYSLKTIEIPRPDLSRYVRDEQALLVLGKALF
jgi:hypothetical protein